MENYENPEHPFNSQRYHSGFRCAGYARDVECDTKAGTAWSPYFCQECNAKRIRRISRCLSDILSKGSET